MTLENSLTQKIRVVELLPEELLLLKKIGDFSIDITWTYEIRQEILDASFNLSYSILKRNAVPFYRLRYFDDPKHNLSNPKRSRLDNFMEKLSSVDEIMKQPTFLKYLKYFIYGPDLPTRVVSELVKIKEEVFYDDEFFNNAKPLVSFFCRNSPISKSSLAEEFYKLSLELEIESGFGEQLRNYVMRLK